MIQEILSAIQAGKAAVDIAKGITTGYKHIHETLDKITALNKDEALLELKTFLFESRKRELSLLELCFSKDEKIKQLEFELSQKKSIKLIDAVFQDGEGHCYCPACYQSKEARAVRLLSDNPDESEAWRCPVCKNYFESCNAELRLRKRVEQYMFYPKQGKF